MNKKIFWFGIVILCMILVLVSFVSAVPSLIDINEESCDDGGLSYGCPAGDATSQNFEVGSGESLSAGDNISFEFYGSDATTAVGSELINITIIAVDGAGDPTGSPKVYGWKTYEASYFPDATAWWGKNATIQLDEDLPEGWYGVTIFNYGANAVGFCIDLSSGYHGQTAYSYYYIDSSCSPFATATDYENRALSFRVYGVPSVPPPDIVPPSFINNVVNNSYPTPEDDVNFSINISDDIGLSGYIFSYFNVTSDDWFNESFIVLTGASANVSILQHIPEWVRFNYTWFANDTSDNWNGSGLHSLQINNFPPTFSGQSQNDTTLYYLDWVNMSINISDANPKKSKFAWNISGTWVEDGNEAWEDGENMSVVKEITIPHLNICWRWWAEDRGKNDNTSAEMCFDVLNTLPENASIFFPENNSNVTELNWSFGSFDWDGDGIYFIVYLNDTLTFNTTTNITDYTLADGDYRFKVQTYDNYSYSANSSSQNFTKSTYVEDEVEAEEEIFAMGTCPTGNIQEVILFAFIGFFLMTMLIVSILFIKIPFMTILIGVAFIMFSFLFYPCNALISMVMIFFAIGLIVFEFLNADNSLT